MSEYNKFIRQRNRLEEKFKKELQLAIDGDFKAASKLSGCAKRLIKCNLRLSKLSE